MDWLASGRYAIVNIVSLCLVVTIVKLVANDFQSTVDIGVAVSVLGQRPGCEVQDSTLLSGSCSQPNHLFGVGLKSRKVGFPTGIRAVVMRCNFPSLLISLAHVTFHDKFFEPLVNGPELHPMVLPLVQIGLVADGVLGPFQILMSPFKDLDCFKL